MNIRPLMHDVPHRGKVKNPTSNISPFKCAVDKASAISQQQTIICMMTERARQVAALARTTSRHMKRQLCFYQ